MFEKSCDVDNFAIALTDLIGNVFEACDENLSKAVEKSTKKGARLLRGELTKGIGRHDWSEEYRKGFGVRFDRSGGVTIGEVGNKKKPGLVHLLEHGHLVPSGRRTDVFEHMKPASERMSEDFIKNADEAIDSALRS